MTSIRKRFRNWQDSFTRADEPRTYDRRFYVRAFLGSLLIIIIAVGVVVYAGVFETRNRVEPTPDISSLYMTGSRVSADTQNPCIVLQEYLEAMRNGHYREAYNDYLCTGMKKEVTYEAFLADARSNDLLFKEVSAYDRSQYTVNGTAAGANIYIEYRTGGRSRVDAAFAKEGNEWKISQMSVIFQ